MTLDTRIAVRAANVSAHEIFMYCRTLLSTPDGTPYCTEADNHTGEPRNPGEKELWHRPGLGLDAWLMLYYGADGSLPCHVHDDFCDAEVGPAKWDTRPVPQMVTQEMVDEHAEWVASDPTENGWATVEISIDTAYGFKGDNGESCSDRHARFIHELGLWLDTRGCEWMWKNEYTGEWFTGRDGLDAFGRYHASEGGPGEWFAGVVIPAIAASMIEEEL